MVANIWSQNLENRNMPRFLQHWRILPSGVTFQILILYVVHTKIFVWPAFTNVFGFLLIFSTPWKSSVKEHRPKKSLFQICWLIFTICYLRQKRGWNIFEFPKSWQMTDLAKNKQSWIWIKFWVNKWRAWAVISQSWTFENNRSLHFYSVCWHKQPPHDQTIQFGHQVLKHVCLMVFCSYDFVVYCLW